MSAVLSKNIFDFLKKLAKNNNRDWFNEHKEEYLEHQQEFQAFMEDLISELGKSDENIAKLDAKKSLQRIYRDIRFSKDKTPYKIHLGASLGMGKGGENAGHYLHIEPGKSFVASGIYMPEASLLKEIRKEINAFPEEFKKAISHKDFKKYFGELDREHELKKIPQGYEKDNPMADFLRLKSFVGLHRLSDTDVLEKDAVKKIAGIMKCALPLNEFLNTPFR
ncbi:hypothetical protein ASG01_09905 [Chryseobacterium sp. Leaf180]|nr:hypothetical protein ASG01_09905 [Chryseobacterium sp. Leaf180]